MCLWNGINFTASGEITVSTKDVFDDARNKAADKTGVITVDLTPPEIRSVKMINDSLTADCPINGDTIHYEIKAFDQTPQVYMTTNGINVSTTRTFDGYCGNTSGSGDWKCDLFIDKIVPFHRNGTILFEVEDFAGNKAKFDKSITICKGDLITNPNFVNVTLGNTIPNSIDRKIASLTNHLILVPMSYTTKQDVRVVRTDDDDCINSLQYVYEGYPVNTINAFSHNPMLSLKLRQGQYPSPVPISCQMRLRLRAGTTVFVKPELENITFNVNFNDNSLGNLNDAINQKLSAVNSDIQATQGKIDSKEKQLKMLKTICETAKMIGQINSLLQKVKQLMGHILLGPLSTCTAAVPALCLAKSQMECGCPSLTCGPCVAGKMPSCINQELTNCNSIFGKIWTSICKPLSKFDEIVRKYIWPQGYLPDFGGDGLDAIGLLLIKYPCMIQYYCVGMEEILGNMIMEGANTYVFPQIEASFSGSTPPSGTSPLQTPSSPGGAAQQPTNAGGTGVIGDIVGAVIQPGGGDLDPYKSVHLQGACVPAQMYNLMKEKQIKCMYRDCLKNHLNTGISTTACDVALSERECLYIEGAGAKGRGSLFSSALGGLKDFKRVFFLLAGIAYKMYCQDYIKMHQQMCQNPPATAYTGPLTAPPKERINICSITGTVITLKELMETFQSIMGPGGQKYEKYFALIKQKDFCASAA